MVKKALLSSVVVASLCIPALAKDNNTQSGQDWFHYDNTEYSVSQDQSSASNNTKQAKKEAKESKTSNVEQNKDFSSKNSEQLSSEDTSLKLSPRKGLYMSVSAGALAPYDNSTADGSSSVSLKAGPTASAAVGTYLGDFRAEAEISYSLSDIDSGMLGGTHVTDVSGHFDSLSFMGNLYYDLHLTPTLDFYIGGGAGAAHEYGEFTALGKTENGKDWVFAYQGMAGFSLQVSKGAFVTLGYKYFSSLKPTLGHTKFERPESHQAMIGLRIDL